MKRAFVTGGSKGIGFGIAEALMKDGYQVAITGRNIASLDDAVKKLNAMGKGNAIALVCDVRDYNALKKAVASTLEEFGGIDVVVANAGLGHFAPVESLTIEQWNETIDTNLTGVFYTVKATLPALMESKGYIITISSLAGTNFFSTASAYNASKFGLTGFTQAIMLDLRKYGIKVTTIMPGSVATEFNGGRSVGDESWKIQSEDIGQMVSDLLKLNPRTLPSKIEVRPSLPKG